MNNELWLSNTLFVNDRTECNALWSHTDLFDEKELTNSFVIDNWKHLLRSQSIDSDLYIASFSKVADSLEQWRAYGNFCIGFDAKKLARSGFSQYDCVYSKDDIKAWILEKEKAEEWNRDSLNDLSKRSAAFNLLYTASMKFKNEHFAAEEEVRLMSVSNYTWMYPNSPSMYVKYPPIHFRDHLRYQLPIPFVKFYLPQSPDDEFSDNLAEYKTYQEMKEKKLALEGNSLRSLLPIRELIIGPMPNQKDVEMACKILLAEKGYTAVKVMKSEIPFRG